MKANEKTTGAARRLLIRYAALWLVPLAGLIGLLVFEGILRIWPQLLPESAQIKRLYQLQTQVKSIGDPYMGFVYPAHYRETIKSLDFEFLIESDEHGFRNDSPWPERADIVIVGDSMVYGWGVEKENAWATLLAERMPEIRIVNLGLPGTGPQQYFRYFERFGVQLKPKLLVFGIFAGNDLVGAEVFDRWVAAGSPGDFNVWRFFEGRPPDRRSGLLRSSLVGMFVKSALDGIGQSYAAQTHQTPEGGKLQLVPSVYQKTLRHLNPEAPAFVSVIRSVVAARDLARQHDTEIIALLFPTKEGVYLPLRDAPFPSLTQPLAEALTANGIEVIDLTEPLRERAAEGKKLFFRIDGHPNKHGNYLISKVMERRLKKMNFAQGTPAEEPILPQSSP